MIPLEAPAGAGGRTSSAFGLVDLVRSVRFNLQRRPGPAGAVNDSGDHEDRQGQS